MKNILVIGGGGYIGSHLIPQLIETGRRVTVLGRNPLSKYDSMHKDVNYVSGDFAQLSLIRRLIDEHQEVIHLAFASVPNTSFQNPLEDLLQNLPPTLQLFSEVASKGVKLILVSSGGTVYGEGVELPINESHITKPISPYGVTKLTLENYAYLYSITHGLKFICVRPSNAYGIGQIPFIGQGFIATAIASAINGIPVNIYGEYGSVRDYIYVSDLSSGIVSALNHGSLSEVYNIGSGIGLSNMDVINIIKPLMNEIGYELNIKKLETRTFDVKTNILNSTKLQQDTGWLPKVEFAKGILETRDWLNLKLNGK